MGNDDTIEAPDLKQLAKLSALQRHLLARALEQCVRPGAAPIVLEESEASAAIGLERRRLCQTKRPTTGKSPFRRGKPVPGGRRTMTLTPKGRAAAELLRTQGGQPRPISIETAKTASVDVGALCRDVLACARIPKRIKAQAQALLDELSDGH